MKSLFFLLASMATTAAAQDTISDGTAGIEETIVRGPDLNVQACTEANSITVDVSYTGLVGAQITDDAMLLVWLEADDDTECFGDNVPGSGEDLFVGEIEVSTAFADSNENVRIPDDLETALDSGQTPVLTSESLLTLRNACPEGGNETVTLCIGLDADGDGNIEEGSGVVAFEPSGWVRFDLDTERPPKPNTPTILPLDGRLRVTTRVSADGDKDDIREYQGFMRPEPEEVEDRGVPCDQWEESVRKASIDVVGPDSATFDISGRNGVTYEVCVFAIDDVGNFSVPSDLATGTPQEECDFIECYPDGFLEPGCSATGGAPLAGVWLLLFALRRARERR